MPDRSPVLIVTFKDGDRQRFYAPSQPINLPPIDQPMT
jgi:hypothetical protein